MNFKLNVPDSGTFFQHNLIMYLSRQPRGVLVPDPSLAERGKLMSTYEEFMVILTVAGLIVSILNLKNK